MMRLILFCLGLFLLSSFKESPPVAGRWYACGSINVGDAKIEVTKRSQYPCATPGYEWTDLILDTLEPGRAAICHSSCGNIPPGTPCLAAAGTCRYGKWSYDASISTIAITDSITVYYLVTSITDSSMTLIKK